MYSLALPFPAIESKQTVAEPHGAYLLMNYTIKGDPREPPFHMASSSIAPSGYLFVVRSDRSRYAGLACAFPSICYSKRRIWQFVDGIPHAPVRSGPYFLKTYREGID